MKVFVPTPLRSYTANRAEVQAAGTTVRDLLADLDRQFPGMRFRMIDEQNGIREHIRIFVNSELVHDMGATLAARDEVQIICALSGGC